MIIFDLAQKYGRYSHYPIRAGPDVFITGAFRAPHNYAAITMKNKHYQSKRELLSDASADITSLKHFCIVTNPIPGYSISDIIDFMPAELTA